MNAIAIMTPTTTTTTPQPHARTQYLLYASTSSSMSEASASMERIRCSLTSGSLAACGRPGLVTVARSSMDPYTPPERVRWLQAQVIGLVTEVYGAVEVDFDLEYEQEGGGCGECPKRGTGPEAQPQSESNSKRPRTTAGGV
mmetsp:Transcript_103519/g.297441  ORF Transcript_103519/g.297441 Transcript_103519/m.297441 type:complete len:142 (-) Transcript_103519:78-503(-)